MTPQDALTVLNFLDQAPSHHALVLRQDDTLIRYAQPGSPGADRIRRDAEILLALSPHGLPGPELLELDLSGRRTRHAFSLQMLPHPGAMQGREGEGEALWHQVGAYLHQLHDLPILATGFVIPSPDPLRLLEDLNENMIITDSDTEWLSSWITSLQQEAGEPRMATLHGSLRPANLLLSPDRQRLLGVQDWTCAHAGDTARDVVHLPLNAYGAISEGYGGPPAPMLLAFITRLLLDLRDAAQGHPGLAAATTRLLALFQFKPSGSTGEHGQQAIGMKGV
ncbi:phosphotransferase [Deinococcus soli (ex Cha et al. 2016)]|uniref:Aminoglycoside phosphotransferase (APT) family kinase protein n=2 Tax=Deinococcus soli (ex Cha et al. 2016) TaxID=1309411 RepID=A0ACC6KJS8_9DEIO|nr:phosphotransferase [Deinococcus soli (ex Cha et al. 2016)]MDR6219853.1 aminoglycoside phosphotransferase (APT) family kinase protein [Deinococcus soli (ex Cha et al. 2016)]MDR6329889.1 aminoglycoside phosphotransferase (APT) family kinase protein [Deinococcus soli (ex Cha et al. 2016)]MDR6752760.1 aminoglycoside phosphotransferase (APT) family kinase protein [Deinococcus soli (ex Cha et al. 2016)]